MPSGQAGRDGAPAEPALVLYVADGTSERSRRATENLRRIAGAMARAPRVEVVDVTVRPDRAEHDRIIATPTLVLREAWGATRRVIGDLSEHDAVLRALGLPPRGP
jgi:circadian clock protein KaiB